MVLIFDLVLFIRREKLVSFFFIFGCGRGVIGDCCYLRRKETNTENDGTRGGTARVGSMLLGKGRKKGENVNATLNFVK